MRTTRLSGQRTQARHHTTRSLKIICQTRIESESESESKKCAVIHNIHASEMCVWGGRGRGVVRDPEMSSMRCGMQHKYIKNAR